MAGRGGATTVRTATPRHGLRSRPHADGGLVVEARDCSGGWARVDDDVVRLVRTVTRQLAVDPAGTVQFARDVATLAGVDVRDAGPVDAVLRATYPLLGAADPFPLPALPGSLPAPLQPAFRQRDLRSAACHLFGRRATRPVTRALAGVLTARVEGLDLFRLTVAVAVAELLEPDQLVRVLQAPAGRDVVDLAALARPDTDHLVGLLRDVPRRRALALLTAAMSSGDDRARVRYVLDAVGHGVPVRLDGRRTWRAASTAVALATPDVDTDLPAPAPSVPVPAHPRWALHLARTGRDLVDLSRRLDNCLDTYVGRLGRHDRIVEVRDRLADGRSTYAIHLRRGHVLQFRGHANREPDDDHVREIVDLLDRHDRFTDAADTDRVDVDDAGLVALSRALVGRGARRDRPDWSEVGIAFWLAGLLRDLPDPAVPASERVVRDLAELAVHRRLAEVPRETRRLADLRAAEARLRPCVSPRTRSGSRHRMMLAAVRQAIRHAARG